MPYVSDNSYLAIIPEATDGTPLVPTTFVPLVSESIRTVVNHSPDDRMKGYSWGSDDMLRGVRQHEGDVVVLADSTTLAHLLNMTYAKGTTTGGATGYTHPFTVGDPKSYTIEIKKGAFVHRYFGVKVNELTLAFEDGRLQATMNIKAKGQFSVASLGAALTGVAGTELTLEDAYDEVPTRGLVIGDVIVVGTDELTLTAVNDTTVEYESATLTYSVGEPIYLKAQTASTASLPEPFMFGQALVGFGADETAATTAAGSRATATPAYDLKVVFKNNLFASNGSERHDPVQIYPQRREAELTLKQLLENEDQRQAWLDREKQAITMIVSGRTIDGGTTKNKLTLKFHNVKLTDNNATLSSGELISEEQTFAVLYDTSDGKALTMEVVNPTADTAY